MNEQVNFSSLFEATFDTIKNNAQLVGVFLAIMIPVGALSAMFKSGSENQFFGMSRGFMIDQALISQGPLAVVVVVGAGIVGLVANYWLLAGMTRGSVSPGFDRFWPYLGISILSGLGIALGMVLLIVPGIILAVRWLPILVMVIDRQDGAMDAFGDSMDITSGHSWPIFGVGLVLFILLIVIGGALGGLAAFAAGGGGIVVGAVTSIAESAGAIVFGAFAVGAYHLLRDNSAEVAEVFE